MRSPSPRPLVAILAVLLLAGCADAPTPSAAPSPTVARSDIPPPAASPRPVPAPSAARIEAGPPDAAPFTDPGELAGALVAAERALADPGTGDTHARGWAWVQQQAYRDVAANPSWRQEVRAALPDDLHEPFDANVAAGAALRELTKPRTELPDWRIVPPPPAEELRSHYAAASDEFGVDWTILAAIHLVETRMGRIRGVSTAGAKGPMQFLPSTWSAYGEGDIEDPRDAIRAAARYLVAHGAPKDMRGALWAYNHSNLYVDAVLAYAGVMRADERAYLGYYHWRVYYRTVNGDVILDEGYGA